MKPAPHFLPPRQQVVYDHTRRALNATALCVRKFAMRVAETYMELASPENRQVKFRMGVTFDDLIKAERHNAQILGRYMDGTVKVLPCDLEDAWVLSLPEPYRTDCERDLAVRRGRYSEKRIADTEQGEAVSLAHIVQQFGELLDAVSPALADGRITDADRPFVRRILNKSDDLIAALLPLRKQLLELVPEGQKGG